MELQGPRVHPRKREEGLGALLRMKRFMERRALDAEANHTKPPLPHPGFRSCC